MHSQLREAPALQKLKNPPLNNGGEYALYGLYLFSPDNPWHSYLIQGGEMPLALYTVKQHLTTVDSSLAARFEGDELMDTIFLCFAAYFNAHKGAAWDSMCSHLETSFDLAEYFFNDRDKEDTLKDIILAFEENILESYQTEVPELWEVALKQIPWFIEGVPAYFSGCIQSDGHTETIDDMAIAQTVYPQRTAPLPLLQIAPTQCSKEKPNACKESLKKTWDEDIKPFLKKTKAKFKRFVEKVKDSPEFQKAKQEFDKAERELRSFRKEATQEVKKFFKKKW